MTSDSGIMDKLRPGGSPGGELVLLQPLATRVFHWVQAGVIFLKIGTGWYLHYPAGLNLPMNMVRELHFFLAYLLLLNFILYGYYYLRTGYYHTIIFKLADIKHLPGFFRYVFFLAPNHPYYGKYNPGQKLVYTSWFLLIILQMVTGFALYFINASQGFFVLAGGVQRIRLYHFLGMVVFLVTVPIHLYLVLTEDPARLQAMFSGYIRKS